MNSSIQPLLLAEFLGKVFHDSGDDIEVLRDFNLRVEIGESVAVVGGSGSGKSTLLHMLGGLEQPSQGRVRIAGRDWSELNKQETAKWRNLHLGFVYQFHHLIAELNTEENVALPLLIRRRPADESMRRARETLDRLGLSSRLNHRPAQLSGGERQRVAIARALVGNPQLLLADEPTGNLDPSNANGVFETLRQGCAENRCALLLVTHDANLAKQCQRQITLNPIEKRQTST